MNYQTTAEIVLLLYREIGNNHGCSWFLLKHEKYKTVKSKIEILVSKNHKKAVLITAEETKSRSRFHAFVRVPVYKPRD